MSEPGRKLREVLLGGRDRVWLLCRWTSSTIRNVNPWALPWTTVLNLSSQGPGSKLLTTSIILAHSRAFHQTILTEYCIAWNGEGKRQGKELRSGRGMCTEGVERSQELKTSQGLPPWAIPLCPSITPSTLVTRFHSHWPSCSSTPLQGL